MPNRVIKESITTSDTLAQVSAEAERLFWRLVVLADDYGLYDGRPMTILGKGFTAFLGTIKPKDVASWMDELEAAGLIRRYAADGKSFVQLLTWDRHQQTRAKRSKYPQPQETDCTPDQPLASDSNCNPMLADVTGNGNGNDIRERERSANALRPLLANDSVSEIFEYYRAHIQPTARLIPLAREKIKKRLADYSPAQLKEAVDRFAADPWRMENNSHEGAAWFFHSQDRIEKFLNLVPRQEQPPNGRVVELPRKTYAEI